MNDEGLIDVEVEPERVEQLTVLCRVMFESPIHAIAALAYTISSISVDHSKADSRDKAKAECLRVLDNIYDHVQGQQETLN